MNKIGDLAVGQDDLDSPVLFVLPIIAIGISIGRAHPSLGNRQEVYCGSQLESVRDLQPGLARPAPFEDQIYAHMGMSGDEQGDR